MRYEIRLAGRGGQGLVLAGLILGEAALISGRNVAMSQSYAPRVRGGTSLSEVVIDEEEIIYPKATSPHLLLVMSQEALEEQGSQLRPGGTVIIDSTEVGGEPQVEGRVISVPITRLARERLRAVAANMVALGVLGGATGIISKEELIEALRAHAPKGTERLNEEALELGWEEGERAKEGLS
ncbi:MAG TPA: 2-oxoacid:ferredoxin oxidoreductase subunit gamma [Chloroflexi bacterium]|nr:2-oxoacid:ferredoxin oxidoreductase subunit gamma [Chloroflexota bacterium]